LRTRRVKVFETTIGNWQRHFLDGDAAASRPVACRPEGGPSSLLDEVADLNSALGVPMSSCGCGGVGVEGVSNARLILRLLLACALP
jgi:hypothetical protein